MPDFNRPAETLDVKNEYIDLLVQREQWANELADYISTERGIDRKVALGSARWACMWRDDYDSITSTQPGDSEMGEITKIRMSQCMSMDRCEGVEREEPGGVPTQQAIVAANEAFCLSFEDRADYFKVLLGV